jgi:hypothetical protein
MTEKVISQCMVLISEWICKLRWLPEDLHEHVMLEELAAFMKLASHAKLPERSPTLFASTATTTAESPLGNHCVEIESTGTRYTGTRYQVEL